MKGTSEVALTGAYYPPQNRSRYHYKYFTTCATIASFGNARYQIGRVIGGYALQDATAGHCIAMNVTHWRQKGDFAYIIREQGWHPLHRKYPPEFFLIDLPTNSITRYSSLARIPAAHRLTFKTLQ